MKVNKIIKKLKRANYIYIIGNGGSAAAADHFASDLQRCGLRAISLCSNMAVITSIANDFGYEHVFRKQLMVLMRNSDVLVTISNSGKSANVLQAIKWARAINAQVIEFPTGDTFPAENKHIELVHKIAAKLRKNYYA